MAPPAFLWVTGAKLGLIKGSVEMRGKEGAILVFEVNHEVNLLSSSASGAARRRMHRPLTVVAEADMATPPLYTALATAELISQVRLDLFRSQPGGQETNHLRIELNDALISSIHYQLPNAQADDAARHTDTIEINFEYATIEWTWTDGPITAIDTWQAGA